MFEDVWSTVIAVLKFKIHTVPKFPANELQIGISTMCDIHVKFLREYTILWHWYLEVRLTFQHVQMNWSLSILFEPRNSDCEAVFSSPRLPTSQLNQVLIRCICCACGVEHPRKTVFACLVSEIHSNKDGMGFIWNRFSNQFSAAHVDRVIGLPNHFPYERL